MSQVSRSVFGSVATDHAVAGFLSGFSSSVLLHPFDLIKTRLQVQHTGSLINAQGKSILYHSTVGAIRTIFTTEGPRALYKGLGPSMLGNMVGWAGYFWCYETFKQVLKGEKNASLGSLEHAIAGMGAGCTVLLLTNPIWVLKTRAILDVRENGRPRSYQGVVGELRHLWRQGGVPALYKGLGPGLLGTSHGAIQISAYERIRAWRFRGRGVPEGAGQRLNAPDYIFCAASSKCFASIITYPYQVLRSRLQDPQLRYDGMMHCIRTSIKNEGIAGLYHGLALNTVKVLPSCCIIFWVYEEVTHHLSTLAQRGFVVIPPR